MKVIFLLFFLSLAILVFDINKIEKWDYFEVSLKDPSEGNPYIEVTLTATFTNGSKSEEVKGLYNTNRRHIQGKNSCGTSL